MLGCTALEKTRCKKHGQAILFFHRNFSEGCAILVCDFHFPGGHTPTEQEVKTWYAPLAQKMMMEFSAKEERYFQHFKGGKYKFIHSAFDSETQERMVVYQALYGDQAYWVRPEDMFFGKVTRDGRTFNRFTEIDKF